MIEIQIEGLDEALRKIRAIPKAVSSRGVLKDMADIILSSTQTRYETETSPTGVPWPPSQAALIREFFGQQGGTLYDTGQLFTSIKSQVTGDKTAEVGTNVAYARDHQEGVGQEKREFLGVTPTDISSIRGYLVGAMVQGFHDA